jgi:hypothetical protein
MHSRRGLRGGPTRGTHTTAVGDHRPREIIPATAQCAHQGTPACRDKNVRLAREQLRFTAVPASLCRKLYFHVRCQPSLLSAVTDADVKVAEATSWVRLRDSSGPGGIQDCAAAVVGVDPRRTTRVASGEKSAHTEPERVAAPRRAPITPGVLSAHILDDRPQRFPISVAARMKMADSAMP